MGPYRPLFVVRQTQERSGQELRGLALLLVLLGALRLVPALLRGEAANTQTILAALMLLLGSVVLARLARGKAFG